MTDVRIQQTIGLLLRVGVLLSAAVMAAGAVWYLVEQGSSPVMLTAGVQPPWAGPQLLMLIALMLLIATPVARVAFSLVAFVLERDYVYVGIASLVLVVLVVSIASSWW